MFYYYYYISRYPGIDRWPFPSMRWAQTLNHGILPNEDLANAFHCSTYDIFGKEGQVHENFKQMHGKVFFTARQKELEINKPNLIYTV